MRGEERCLGGSSEKVGRQLGSGSLSIYCATNSHKLEITIGLLS